MRRGHEHERGFSRKSSCRAVARLATSLALTLPDPLWRGCDQTQHQKRRARDVANNTNRI
jgi:hypothetical protein